MLSFSFSFHFKNIFSKKRNGISSKNNYNNGKF